MSPLTQGLNYRSACDYKFFVCGPKFTSFLSPNVEGVVIDEVFFQMFDMSISAGDIHDQSRKLSEIAPKF